METESEKLLESLLNLERSLQREQDLRRESETLLRGLRGLNEAQDTETLFRALVEVLHSVLDFDHAFILQIQDDDTLTPVTSTSPRFLNTVWPKGDLFRRVEEGPPIAVFDLAAVPEWSAMPEAVREGSRSAVHLFLNDDRHGSILVCTHSEPRHFGPSHVRRVARFAPLASQALLSLIHLKMLNKANEEMLRTQKLESLGVLAGGIAHDFNNILTAITGSLSLARQQLNDPKKVEERLAQALNAAARAKDLTTQLLTFAKGGEPVKKLVNLGRIITEAVGFAVTGTAVKCKVEIDEGIWAMEADEGQMSQVIHNLIINAVQAMPGGGIVQVKAENIFCDARNRCEVHVSIADTGEGIPEEHLGKVFDPFFTTKQKGSGLGLATCHSIVKKHDGAIGVSSVEGEGTTIDIYLPAAAEGKFPDQQPVNNIVGGEGHILVMDDEEVVREVITEMLKALGYTVECAENGNEAVQLYQKSRAEAMPFDAVILDLTVPGEVGGKDTIALLKEIDPGVKAIVSSGYSTSPVLANYHEFGFLGIIRKPFRMDEISRVVHDVMIIQ